MEDKARRRLKAPSCKDFYGGPGKTRTCDLRFRKPLLYPAELRDRLRNFVPRYFLGPSSVHLTVACIASHSRARTGQFPATAPDTQQSANGCEGSGTKLPRGLKM